MENSPFQSELEHRQNGFNIPEHYPTDVETAQKQAQKYAAFVESLPLPLRLKINHNNTRFKLNVIGVFPEYGSLSPSILDSLTDEELTVVAEALKKHLPELTLIPHGWVISKNAISIVNVPAATKVMQANADLFPEEALKEPRKWLERNPTAWLDPETPNNRGPQIGVLSGYTRSAAENYVAYTDTINPLIHAMTKEDQKLVFKLLYKDDVTEKDTLQLKELLEKHLGRPMTEREASLLLSARKYRFPSRIAYIGFDGENDKQWVKAAHEIYKASNIESVVRLNVLERVFNPLKKIFLGFSGR